jgi:hypothetical protein
LSGHAAYMGEMIHKQENLVPKYDRMDLEDLLHAVRSDNSTKTGVKETVFEDAD